MSAPMVSAMSATSGGHPPHDGGVDGGAGGAGGAVAMTCRATTSAGGGIDGGELLPVVDAGDGA